MANTSSEQQSNGLIYEPTLYEEATFHNFVLTDSQRTTIDAYLDKTYEILEADGAQSPFYFLGDISHKKVNLTPHFRSKLTELSAYLRDHRLMVYSAIVLAGDLNGRILSIFGNVFSGKSLTVQRYFTKREDADQWIAEMGRKEAEKRRVANENNFT